jgi:hypothetical protein
MPSMPTPPEDTRDRDRWLPLAELLRELNGTHGPHQNLTYYKLRCALLADRLPA